MLALVGIWIQKDRVHRKNPDMWVSLKVSREKPKVLNRELFIKRGRPPSGESRQILCIEKGGGDIPESTWRKKTGGRGVGNFRHLLIGSTC